MLGKLSTWIRVLVLVYISSSAGNAQGDDIGSGSMSEWGQWGGWTECSRTCGRGVATRTRECRMPNSNRAEMKSNCVGVYRDFNTCNSEPCPNGSKEFRAVQCENFNSKRFSGRLFEWEPYYKGRNRCVLACKTKHHRFHARLAEQVADGTRCNPEDPWHICVAGQCKNPKC